VAAVADEDEDEDVVAAAEDEEDDMAAVATPWCRLVSRSCFFSEHMVGAIFWRVFLFWQRLFTLKANVSKSTN